VYGVADKLHASDAPFVEYRAARGCRMGMCGYTAVPEDVRTCYVIIRIKYTLVL